MPKIENSGNSSAVTPDYGIQANKSGSLSEQVSEEELELLKLSSFAEERIEELENQIFELEEKKSAVENKLGPEELNVLNKNQQLVFSEFQDEIVYSEKEDNKQIVIYAVNNKVTRNFYDEEYRLEKKENWEISDVKNSKLLKTESYEYIEGDYKPSVKRITTENTVENIFYNNKGLIQKSDEYKIVDEKKYMTAKTEWTYNSDSRVSSINKIEYLYDDFKSKKASKIQKKRYEYKYHPNNAAGEEIPPDYSYYEAGELKIKESYSDEKGKYSVLVNFNEHRSVHTYYENYLKKKEIFLLDGKTIRVNNYDE